MKDNPKIKMFITLVVQTPQHKDIHQTLFYGKSITSKCSNPAILDDE